MTPEHPDDRHGESDDRRDAQALDWDELLRQLEQDPPEPGWVSVDEAAAAASVSRSTLRSWYRTGQIPSRMVAGIHGPQRLVPLDAVIDRAMKSPRVQKSLARARSLEEEVRDLRRRVEALELLVGLALDDET